MNDTISDLCNHFSAMPLTCLECKFEERQSETALFSASVLCVTKARYSICF